MVSPGRRWFGVVAIVGGLASLCGTARAQAPALPDPALAAKRSTLLTDAANARTAKQWQRCIDALREALTIADAPETRGELGLCQEGADRLTEAYASLKGALDSVPAAKERVQPWATFQAALARVTARTVLFVITASPPSCEVFLDGQPIGKADGRYYALKPGPHTFVGRLDGYQEATESATVAKDKPRNVHLQLIPLPAPPPSVPSVPSVTIARPADARPSTAGAPKSGAVRFVPSASPRGAALGFAYTSAALGLVAASFTIGLEVDRASMASGHEPDTCTDVHASSRFCVQLHERREQRNLAGGLALGLGGLTVGTGLVVVLADILGPRARIAPVVGREGGGLVVGGAW